MENKTRHILALSGGKDSSALAIYMRSKDIDMEYVFCDTEKELDETYEYINKLEAYLGKKIQFLKYADGYGFDDILDIKNGFLPSPDSRWCTDYLKLKPYESFIGDDEVISYVGIRADEAQRKGYISTKPNIKTVFPFIEDNIGKEEVFRILQESGLGVPSYYNWRSRSGCYFCFFQQKREWIGLYENHPDLFEKAAAYEKIGDNPRDIFTWNQGESLYDLIKPQRMAQIKTEYAKRLERNKNRFLAQQRLIDVFEDNEDDGSDRACLICHL
ncbi:MAG: phosphoadenosine phosphosulfate reductase family protein [Candidatus Cloacimonetes bacterium]|nr:phosphoadenosine phosphosulfate reductase family protein [Candidatus Cloacimonadota bacterium]